MDFLKGNSKENTTAENQTTNDQGQGGGLMNKLNSAMGGGQSGEQKEG